MTELQIYFLAILKFKGEIKIFAINNKETQFLKGLFRLSRLQAQHPPDTERLIAPEKPTSAY